MKDTDVKALMAVGVTADQIVKAQTLLADEERAKERSRKANYRKRLREGAENSGTVPDVPDVPGTCGTSEANYLKRLRGVPDVPGTCGTDRYIEPSVSTYLSEEQDPLPLSLDDSYLTTPRPRARSKAHANGGNGHDHFEDFWIAYPDKQSKGAARRAFARALQRATVQQIADGLQRYKESKPADVRWRYPATWLNGDGWLDEPAPPPPKRKTPHQEYREEIDEIFNRMRQETRDRNAKRT